MNLPRSGTSITLARNLCLLLAGLLAAAASAQSSSGSVTGELRIITRPGDPLGIAGTHQYDTTNSRFSPIVRDSNLDGAVDFISLLVERNNPSDAINDWVISFAPIAGSNLAVANYPRTETRDRLSDRILPFLEIRHIGSLTCRENDGEFRVSTMRVAACEGGFILRDFRATFKYRCLGSDIPSSAVLNGTISYGDTHTCAPAPGGGGSGSGSGSGGGSGVGGIRSIPTFPVAVIPIGPVANPTPVETPTASLAFPMSLLESPVLMTHDAPSTVFTIPTVTSGGFDGDIALEVMTDAEDGDGFTATISPAVIPAPGTGEATLTLNLGSMTFPRDYQVTVATTANGETSYVSLVVSVDCDPPMILGIDQPQSSSFAAGSTATASVKSAGRGPFLYQWYNAPVGSTRTPVEGATGATFTTDVEGSYWVRIANACGTADSNAFHVTRK